jgi:RNA-directed DNA polymerase
VQLNQKLKGWAQFYRHTDFTAKVYSKIDGIVFWKLARWLARKYRCRISSLLMKWFKQPEPNKAKTWVLFGKTDQGNLHGASLIRLVGSAKMPFRWRLPESNPYLREEIRNTVTSRYADVAMAVGQG